jgi:polyisoprenoid-binding protein YceI
MTDATLTIAPAGAWQLDPVHSSIRFEVSYLAGTFKGEFHKVDAKLTVEDGRATLEGTANVTSVDVKDETLSAHLQSPDFFDAEQHPKLRFTAEDVRLDAEAVTADGEITIKGVTKPVTVTGAVSAPMADPYGRERIGLNLSAVVDRTGFGLTWNMPLPTGEPALGNEVTIVADVQFVKAA